MSRHLIDGGPTRDVSIVGFGNTDLEEYARADGAAAGTRNAGPIPIPSKACTYRSDSYSFAQRGVPALYLQAGIDSAARGPAWGKAQIDDYFAHRYRQPSDQYSAGLGCARRGRRSDALLRDRQSARAQPPLPALVSEQRVSRVPHRTRRLATAE